ncbi:hypothetical protein CsSME_00045860 [Camellia sinensis var. sinensis]
MHCCDRPKGRTTGADRMRCTNPPRVVMACARIVWPPLHDKVTLTPAIPGQVVQLVPGTVQTTRPVTDSDSCWPTTGMLWATDAAVATTKRRERMSFEG